MASTGRIINTPPNFPVSLSPAECSQPSQTPAAVIPVAMSRPDICTWISGYGDVKAEILVGCFHTATHLFRKYVGCIVAWLREFCLKQKFVKFIFSSVVSFSSLALHLSHVPAATNHNNWLEWSWVELKWSGVVDVVLEFH